MLQLPSLLLLYPSLSLSLSLSLFLGLCKTHHRVSKQYSSIPSNNMAKALHEAGLWPPLLPAGDKNADFDAVFGFPSEFPYEFGAPSPVESVAGSTETESSDEEEDFFAGLTRRLSLNESRKPQHTPPITATNKPEGMARSPQSTLSGIGSWSGRSGEGTPNATSRVPSPSTTPFPDQNDPWEVIYAAAGQVARLKMNGHVSPFDLHSNTGLLTRPRAAPKNPNANAFPNHASQAVKGSVWGRRQQQQQEAKANWLVLQQQAMQSRAREVGYEGVKCGNRFPSSQQSAWPPLERLHFGGSGSRVSGPGGSGPKRGSAGTGVFLPRHYGNPSSEPRKKIGCAAPVVLPAKVVHALNLNIEDLNAAFQPRFSNAFATDYDALLARRNALLMQQQQRLNAARREEAACHEIRLPQEWTY